MSASSQSLRFILSLRLYSSLITSRPGSYFCSAQSTLAGQAQKSIFRLNSYKYKFTDTSTYLKLDLFDKLVAPILNYSAEVCEFCSADKIDIVHLQFGKRLIGIKKYKQNDFVYGELSQTFFSK